MALYLIHCKPTGEPVGIWDDAGEHYYADPTWEKRGAMVFNDKGSKAAWSQWVEDLTHQPAHASMWQSDDDIIPMNVVLDQHRSQFFKMDSPKLDSDSTKR